MIFNSAGHNIKLSVRTKKIDPGAIGCEFREADLTVEQRNLVNNELAAAGAKFISDNDNESLGEYLDRIKTGDGSVVLEYHFDAATSSSATGCTAIIGNDADRLDKAFAIEIVNTTSTILGIRNRGVITEGQSHRGSLGLMREQGIVALIEIGFITNCTDISKWQAKKKELAKEYAKILIKYETFL